MFKKIMATILAVTMVSAMSTTVFADEDKAYVTNVPEPVMQLLEDNNAAIAEGALIEIIPIVSDNARMSAGEAVCVTNTVDGKVTKDIFITYAKEKNDEDYSVESPLQYVSDSQSRDGKDVVYDKDTSRLTIWVTAEFNMYKPSFSFRYYQPYGVGFVYGKNNNSINVSYMSVTYGCEGTEHTYPALTNEGKSIDYMVTASQYGPQQSIRYSAYNPFPSDKTILPTGFNGNYVTCTYTIDGKTVGSTMRIDNLA